MLNIFKDCEPREMIYVESSPPKGPEHLEQGDRFTVKCWFGEPIYAALQDKGKVKKLQRIVKVLVENGMTEVTFIDYKSKQEIVKYSIKSGWDNFTGFSIDFSP